MPESASPFGIPSPLRGLRGLQLPGGGWTPAALFANGENGVWLDPSDLSTMNTLSDQSGTTPGEGDPVGYIADRSGNSNHALETTAARRMTLRQTAGGLWYLERDTVDDSLDISLQLNGSRWTAGMAYVPDGTNWIVVHNTGANNPWASMGRVGSSSTGLAGDGATQNSIFFDNILSTETTRGGQYTLSQTANTIILDFNVTDDWPSVTIGTNGDGIYTSPGDIYGFLLIDRELTTQERSDLQSFFESRLAL